MTEPTVTIETDDHGPVTFPEPDWCAGAHLDGGRRDEICHVGAPIDIEVSTFRGPRRLVELMLWRDLFPPASSPHGTAVYVVAHLLDGDHFGYDVDGLESLVTDLLEAAGQVRRIARRLADERRRGPR